MRIISIVDAQVDGFSDLLGWRWEVLAMFLIQAAVFRTMPRFERALNESILGGTAQGTGRQNAFVTLFDGYEDRSP